jgi:hypothetical protein
MGIDRDNATYGTGHMYLYPFGWGKFTDAEGEKYGLYEIENPAFDYDAATKTFSTDELTIGEAGAVSYYDLSGRRIQRPTKGVFVKTTVAADGTKVAKKILK